LVTATQSKAPDVREWAAIGVDKIGELDAKKKVAEYWMPFLDTEYGGRVFEIEDEFNRRTALDIFSRMSWPPAAEHEILRMLKGGLKNTVGFEDNDIMTAVEKAGIDKRDLNAIVKAARKENVDTLALFHTLGTIGGENSIAALEKYIGENKNKKDGDTRLNIEHAHEAIKEIEKRIGVSAKPAEERIKESIERKPVKVK
jgi:hypothetical protein